MLDSDFPLQAARPPELDPELLAILREEQDERLTRARAHVRIPVLMPVALRPGNASDRLEPSQNGLTADLSRGGVRLLLPQPPRVGDIYRLEFDSAEHALPDVFARCLRCRLLREDAFEAGFAFFQPIELPASLTQPGDEPLG